MIEGVDEKEGPVEHPESIKAVVLEELGKGFVILMEALGKLDIKVVERLNDLEMRVKIIQNFVAAQGRGMTAEGGTPHTGFVLYPTPPPLTLISNPIDDDVDGVETDAVSQLLSMVNCSGGEKENDKAEMEKTEIEDEGEKKKKKKAEHKKKEKKKEKVISDDGEAEENKKRQKLEKIKKNLGDVDVITTGKKRKRNKE